MQGIDDSDDSDGLVRAIPGFSNPSKGLAVMTGALGDADTDNAPEHIPKKARTPVPKSREHAIESSPIADRIGTGSRPPTRARGYSSTLSLAGRQGDSRIPNTPGFENSLLSNFKLRPRQPSILQMVQADDDSSDFEDDDFLGGLSPEDESTPLNVTRGGTLLPKLPTNSVFCIIPPSLSSLGSRSPQKPKTPTLLKAQETHSQGQLSNKSPTPTSHAGDTVWDLIPSDIELPSTPVAVEVFSQTLAPPLSSSPSSPRKDIFDLHNCLDSKDAGGKSNEEYPVPRYKKGKGMPVKLPTLPTTVLQQNFLPRRRILQQNIGNGDDSEDDLRRPNGVDSDEDELSYLTSRKAKSSRSRDLERTNRRAKSKGPNLGPGKKRRKAAGTNKSSNVTISTSSTKPSQHKKGTTYLSRDSEADKENQKMSNDSSSPRASKELDLESGSPVLNPTKRLFSLELERQARKFANVDMWQMDFEDIPLSGSQSSPLR